MSNFSHKFRQVGGRKYRSWKKWEEGDYIIAKFIKDYEDQFNNPGYEVEVIESSFAEEEDFNEGDIVGLNSCGGLNYKMKEVEQGAVIKVEYEGQDVMEKGPMAGKQYHKVNLFVDDTGVQSSGTSLPDEAEEEVENYDL